MNCNNNQEINISNDSESTTDERSLEPEHQKVIEKNELFKLKRRCTFNKEWLKDPLYKEFLSECQTNKYSAHCSICKSNFSISNGGIYLVKRHMEQASHKRLAEIARKEKSKVYY